MQSMVHFYLRMYVNKGSKDGEWGGWEGGKMHAAAQLQDAAFITP